MLTARQAVANGGADTQTVIAAKGGRDHRRRLVRAAQDVCLRASDLETSILPRDLCPALLGCLL